MPLSSRTSRCWSRPGWRRCSRWSSSSHADEETRVERLIKRGMDEADARARIAAQASEEQRRAIADVLLDNSGSQDDLVERARDLWYDRMLPFAHNIRAGRPCREHKLELVPYNPAWPDEAHRIINRAQTACGHKALRVDHVGSTAVPGHGRQGRHRHPGHRRIAGCRRRTRRRPRRCRLSPHRAHHHRHRPRSDDPALWRKRFHGAADPGRPGQSTSGSTAGRISSSRCCSPTG